MLTSATNRGQQQPVIVSKDIAINYQQHAPQGVKQSGQASNPIY